MIPKVLVWVDDGRITVLHTPGVEVAVVIEGEDVTVPDDWVGLTAKQEHSLPITVNRDELPQKRPLACDSESFVAPDIPEPHHSGLMKAPYCYDCDGNHQPGECPGKTEGWVERGMSHMIETTKP